MSEATDEPITEEVVEAAQREGDALEPIDGPDAPPSARADRDSAATIAKAERANQNYKKRLGEILGKDTPLYDCTACDGLGVTFAPVEAAPEDSEFVRADFYGPCETCAAWGVVLTGSKQPGQETAPCSDCGGRGFVNVAKPLAEVQPYTPPAVDPLTPLAGQWVPGRGFVPYGSTEPVPGSLGAS